MREEAIKKMIQRHEGFVPRVYMDTVQVPTGGYGHAFLIGSPISHRIAEMFFEEDYSRCLKDYEQLKPLIGELDPVRRAVIIDMLFNLGLPRLKMFKKTLAAIRAKDFEEAAKEMLDSKWARQVGYRARKLAEMMETGEKGE